jgi:hypothetical protein
LRDWIERRTLQLNERETTAGADTAVVLDGYDSQRVGDIMLMQNTYWGSGRWA